jgi:hypothetical protein
MPAEYRMPQNILENTMSESESDLAATEDKPLSPLLLFSAKVAVVTVAILVILYGAGQLIAFQLESQTEQLAFVAVGTVGPLQDCPRYRAK